MRKNHTKNTDMRLLVIRNSAMGDVVLTVPVLSALRKKYPEAGIIMVTNKAFLPFFRSVEGLQFFHPDFIGRHNGFTGIFRLYRDLKKQVSPDAIIDLHDVLRSKILRFLFRFSGVSNSVIDKGRKEKKDLIKGRKKIFLKHTVERYCDAFRKAGYPVEAAKDKFFMPSPEALAKTGSIIPQGNILNFGVAPFAKHNLKMWPEEYMIRLLQLVAENHSCRFWLFGGNEEAERIKAIHERIPGSEIASGTMNLEEELALMSRLDLMISMDSSNMHMAALAGTKVISIWGGTDPMAGFGAWMQPDSYSIRIPVEELDCRPCTIYGKGKTRTGFACMLRLTPETVYARMMALDLFK